MIYLLICICFNTMLFLEVTGYVLLQVRKKDENYSNIDIIIHKVVPSSDIKDIAKNLSLQKSFTDIAKNNKIIVKENGNVRRNEGKEIHGVTTYIGSINDEGSLTQKSIFDSVNGKKIEKASIGLTTNGGKAVLRAKEKNVYIEPEVVHFRNGKASLVFKVDTKTIMRAINNFLSSKQTKDSINNMTRRAAVEFGSRQSKEEDS